MTIQCCFNDDDDDGDDGDDDDDDKTVALVHTVIRNLRILSAASTQEHDHLRHHQ